MQPANVLVNTSHRGYRINWIFAGVTQISAGMDLELHKFQYGNIDNVNHVELKNFKF